MSLLQAVCTRFSSIIFLSMQREYILAGQLLWELPGLGLFCLQRC